MLETVLPFLGIHGIEIADAGKMGGGKRTILTNAVIHAASKEDNKSSRIGILKIVLSKLTSEEVQEGDEKRTELEHLQKLNQENGYIAELLKA